MKIYSLFLLSIFVLISCGNPAPPKEVSAPKQDLVLPKQDKPLSKKEKMTKVVVGNIIPDGTILNMDSVAIPINQFRGKLLVIDYWATWCSPCLKETPIFKSFAEKYKDQPIHFITISMDQPFSYWKKYIQKNNWKGQNFWLGQNEANPLSFFTLVEMELEKQKSIILGLPQYIFIAPDGKILSHSETRPSAPDFEKRLLGYLDDSLKI